MAEEDSRMQSMHLVSDDVDSTIHNRLVITLIITSFEPLVSYQLI